MVAASFFAPGPDQFCCAVIVSFWLKVQAWYSLRLCCGRLWDDLGPRDLPARQRQNHFCEERGIRATQHDEAQVPNNYPTCYCWDRGIRPRQVVSWALLYPAWRPPAGPTRRLPDSGAPAARGSGRKTARRDSAASSQTQVARSELRASTMTRAKPDAVFV